jgi:hypothetical protein
MHLAAGVIERGDTHKVVLMVLPVMSLLGDAGGHDAAMVVQYGFWEAVVPDEK